MVRESHRRIGPAALLFRRVFGPLLAAAVAGVFAAGCGASLHDTVATGDLERVRALLARNPEALESRDGMEKTPVYFAITYDRVDVLKFLIERGADVNVRDKTGLTPLHVATFMSRPACADVLIKAGAGIDAVDDFGDTPLHSGAIHGMTGMIGFLVRRGADPHAVNRNGETPMDLAVRYHQNRAVETLRKLLETRP